MEIMNKTLPARKLCAQVLIALCALSVGFAAEAKKCKKGDLICEGKKDVNSGINGAKDAGNDIANGANNLASAGAAISKSEMSSMVSTATSAYSSTAGAAQAGYASAQAAIKAAYTAALEALFRTAGNQFVANEKGNLVKLQTRMTALDAEGKQALARVMRAIPTKQISEQTRSDMQTLAAKLGLITNAADANIPGNVKRSSFGIFMGASAALGVGVDASFGIVMNTFLEDGKFKVGLIESAGGSCCAQAGAAVEGAGGAGLMWSPGSIENAAGASIGFGVEGALKDVGGALALSWSISKGMTGAQNAIPGISIAWAPGAKLSAAFNGGWTTLLAKF